MTCANNTSNKGLLSKPYQELIQFSIKNQLNWKMGRGPEQAFFQSKHTAGQQAHGKMLNITITREMQIKTTRGYHPTPVKMCSSKGQEITSGKDLEKKKALCTAVGNVNGYSHYGKYYEGFSKIKNRTTKQSRVPFGYLSEESENTNSKRNMYLCSPQHQLPQPRYGSNLSAHRQMNR